MLIRSIQIENQVGIADFAIRLSDTGWGIFSNEKAAFTLSKAGLERASLFALTGEPETILEHYFTNLDITSVDRV